MTIKIIILIIIILIINYLTEGQIFKFLEDKMETFKPNNIHIPVNNVNTNNIYSFINNLKVNNSYTVLKYTDIPILNNSIITEMVLSYINDLFSHNNYKLYNVNLYNRILYQETLDGKNILPFIFSANFNNNDMIIIYLELFLDTHNNIIISAINILNKDNSTKFYNYIDNMIKNQTQKIVAPKVVTRKSAMKKPSKVKYDDIFIKNTDVNIESGDTDSMIPTINNISTYESSSDVETTVNSD